MSKIVFIINENI